MRTAQKDGVDANKDLRSLNDEELMAFIKSKTYNPEDLKHRLESEFAKL